MSARIRGSYRLCLGRCTMPWFFPPVNNQNCRRYDDRFSLRHPIFDRALRELDNQNGSLHLPAAGKATSPMTKLFYLDVLRKRHKKRRAIIVHKGSSSGISVTRVLQRANWRRDGALDPRGARARLGSNVPGVHKLLSQSDTGSHRKGISSPDSTRLDDRRIACPNCDTDGKLNSFQR
jgi:hypothetical protein